MIVFSCFWQRILSADFENERRSFRNHNMEHFCMIFQKCYANNIDFMKKIEYQTTAMSVFSSRRLRRRDLDITSKSQDIIAFSCVLARSWSRWLSRKHTSRSPVVSKQEFSILSSCQKLINSMPLIKSAPN